MKQEPPSSHDQATSVAQGTTPQPVSATRSPFYLALRHFILFDELTNWLLYVAIAVVTALPEGTAPKQEILAGLIAWKAVRTKLKDGDHSNEEPRTKNEEPTR